MLAGVLNYIPYIGPACIVVILLGVGLVTFPDLIHALLPPVSFVVLTTIEGQIISPTVLGSRLPLSALAIFLSLVFWAWLWGPIGALLAVPLAIIGRVIFNHVLPVGRAEFTRINGNKFPCWRIVRRTHFHSLELTDGHIRSRSRARHDA